MPRTIHSSATLGHLDAFQPAFGSQNMNSRFACTRSHIVPLDPAWPRWTVSCRPPIAWTSRRNDHGMVGVVVFMVQVQHVLHSSHELPAHLRDAPFLLRRLEFVFLSVWRTVSREMLSANPIATTLKQLQHVHSNLQITTGLPVSNRGGAYPLAMSTDLRLPSIHQPRLTLGEEILFEMVRSDSFNSTLYLRAGMSSYVLLIGSYTRLTYFLSLSNTHGTGTRTTSPR